MSTTPEDIPIAGPFGLPLGTIVKATDIYPAVDITDLSSSPTGTTKQYTIAQLLAFINAEVITNSVSVSSPIPLTNITGTNITSISLTAGTWNIVGNVLVTGTGTTVLTNYQGSINTVSATLGVQRSIVSPVATEIQNHDQGVPVPSQTLILTVPTVVYLVVYAVFSGSTLSAYGSITATGIII